MLTLEDKRWSALMGCYGEQSVPVLLTRLLTEEPQPDRGESAPSLWDELMSELEHQGTVYPVTIAAFPFLMQAVARVTPHQRAYWLGWLAYLAGQLQVKALYDPEGQVTPELDAAFDQALRGSVPIVVEALMDAATFEDAERSTAALLALLAFARGESRLGFILAQWWPYGDAHIGGSLVRLASLEQYEELTGDIRDPHV